MKSSKGKRALITAGPTREYIDPVRYISNDSSGLMGFALARAARKIGMKVTLISGPVSMAHPKGVRRLDVISARDMFAEVKKHYKSADIIVMAAAVSDFRPAKFAKRKFKKTIAPLHHRTIALIQNPDILTWLCKNKRKGQTIVGFSLETDDLVKNTKRKLAQKGCDIIVGNYAKVIGGEKTSAVIIDKKRIIKKVSNVSKKRLALEILMPGICLEKDGQIVAK